MFLRAIASAKADKYKADLLSAWHANNADDKQIKQLTSEGDYRKIKKGKTNVGPSQKTVDDNWGKMNKFFGSHK